MQSTAVKNLFYRDEDHTYWWRKHKPVSRGIVRDFTCHQAVPSITAILARGGLSRIDNVPEAALRRGTAVHALCEEYLGGIIEQNPKALNQMAYLKGFDQFVRDMQWKPIHSERVIFSRQHWYCGRLDAIFELPSQKKRKKNILVEIKTNTRPDSVGPQLAAQKWAAIESKIPVHAAGCLTLLPNDYRWWEQKEPERDWQRFRECLEKK